MFDELQLVVNLKRSDKLQFVVQNLTVVAFRRWTASEGKIRGDATAAAAIGNSQT